MQGVLKMSSTGAISIILPAYMTPTISARYPTTLRSWDIKTRLSFSSRCKRFNRFSTCACTETSSEDTGSSAMISLGLAARAHARCRCAGAGHR